MTAEPCAPRVRVIGLGNPWRGDDAAGLLAARRSREECGESVEVIEVAGDPVSLLDAWGGAEEAIVIDAVRSGAPAGTVHRIEAHLAPVPAALAGPSTHAFGLGDAVELSRALGSLPHRLLILGIECGSVVRGTGVSAEVMEGVDAAAAAVRHELAPTGPLRASPAPS